MSRKLSVLSLLIIVSLPFACLSIHQKTTSQQAIDLYKEDVQTLKTEVSALVHMIEKDDDGWHLQQQFKKARLAYKQTEWLAEYYNSYTAKSINGPAIAEVEADEKTKLIEPEGFQVIEELLFPSYNTSSRKELLQQSEILESNAGRLQYVSTLLEITDAHVFDAMRLQVFRIITLGISGFDSPIANNSLEEASASLVSIAKYCRLYHKKVTDKSGLFADSLEDLLANSKNYLSDHQDFNSFDRMYFISKYLNPLSKALLTEQKLLNIPVFTEPRFLKANAETLFAENIFNPDYYAPGTDAYSNNNKIELGKKLFYGGILSGDGKRSCATCHQPEKAFTDGLKTSLAVSGKNVRRNSPTLINAALQPSLFYDMRVSFLEDQAKDVISNKDEMHGDLAKAVTNINSDRVYQRLFNAVYPGQPVSEFHIKNAIASYIRSLVGLNSRFDMYMRGDHLAMSDVEIRGFNVFMGKAKCGTCHFTPLFNGNNPPAFNKTDAEVIGVPATTDTVSAVLDADDGKYALYKVDLHKHAFKTPTLRNIALTAPYMHNGVYNTLEEVVGFYDKGGGAGLGFEIPNQTLPGNKLHLNGDEKKALIAFMKTLTDNVTNKKTHP